MEISLIISTYNSPRALSASLHSVMKQTMKPSEVLIADDGSTDNTAEIIEQFRNQAPFPVIHVRQENKGFRLAMIRNKAIAKAKGSYIIQIDGDIILHPDFIADHVRIARKGRFVCGSRVLIHEDLTNRIYSNHDITLSPWTSGISNRKNAIRSKLLGLAVSKFSSRLKYRGCNMAFWRDDLISVNGYDESFLGWGCEDHDLVARLINLGVTPLQARHQALCFHLWHPSSKKSDTFQRNNELLEETRREKRVRSLDGLDKYLGSQQS